MGAQIFTTFQRGATAALAFQRAREDALYEYGHRGYTGTIAEKDNFIEISVPEGKNPKWFAQQLLDNDDKRIFDKWGPAGCVKIKDGEYWFFGWASC